MGKDYIIPSLINWPGGKDPYWYLRRFGALCYSVSAFVGHSASSITFGSGDYEAWSFAAQPIVHAFMLHDILNQKLMTVTISRTPVARSAGHCTRQFTFSTKTSQVPTYLLSTFPSIKSSCFTRNDHTVPVHAAHNLYPTPLFLFNQHNPHY